MTGDGVGVIVVPGPGHGLAVESDVLVLDLSKDEDAIVDHVIVVDRDHVKAVDPETTVTVGEENREV